MIPVAFLAMWGISQEAQALHDKIIKGQLAYAQVQTDANSLRAASLEAATNPNAAHAAAQLDLAKTLVKKFPDDARKMVNLFVPEQSTADSQTVSFATPTPAPVGKADRSSVWF